MFAIFRMQSAIFWQTETLDDCDPPLQTGRGRETQIESYDETDSLSLGFGGQNLC